MTGPGDRTGFLPSARTQIDLAILQAAVANKVAHHQASIGVDEDRAVDHATTVAAVTVSWWLFVLVPTVLVLGLMQLGGGLHPLLMLWEAGIVATVAMQRVRLSEWRDRPAGVPGRSPSGWWFAIGGAVWAYGFPLVVGVTRVLL